MFKQTVTVALAATLSLALAVGASSQAIATKYRGNSPRAVSPTIGYVYGAGLTQTTGGGIVVYAQHADGSLNNVQDIGDGDAVHATVLVHLKSGLAVYDLTRHGLNAFRVNMKNGHLTSFTIPTPSSPVSAISGLGVYDPLAYGLAGQPILVTGACGTATADLVCPFRYEVFHINTVTGMPDAGTLGAVSSAQLQTGITSDGRGKFAFSARSAGYDYTIQFAKAVVINGTTTVATAGFRSPADNMTGQNPQPQSIGSTILITTAGMVDFPASPLSVYADHPGGWVAYGFGSAKAAPYEARVDAEVTASVQGVKSVFVGEDGGNLPTGKCAVEAFGIGDPGLGGVRTLFPCTNGSPNFVNSLYELNGYMYVGLYGSQSLGFHDVGAADVTPTKQNTIPSGIQMYSWTGFSTAKPSVKVPASLSLKVGIPVTITCPTSCSAKASAVVKIGASKVGLLTQAVQSPVHGAGSFVVKIAFSAALKSKLGAALKKGQGLSVITTTKVAAGGKVYAFSQTSKMHA